MKTLQRKIRKFARLRRIIALDGLSTVLLDPSNIQNPAEMQASQTAMAEWMNEFQNLYKHLLNNVRVNFPQKLTALNTGFAQLSEITVMDPQEIADNTAQVQQQATTSNTQVNTSSNTAVTLMRTIVDECNQLIRALNG